MKTLTYLVYVLLIACVLACGHPDKKRKHKIKKHKIEHRMKNDTIHNDSAKQARVKMWKEKKKHKNK